MLVSFWDIVNGVFGYLFALLTGNVDGWLHPHAHVRQAGRACPVRR